MGAVFFFSSRKALISLAQKRHTVKDPICDNQSSKELYWSLGLGYVMKEECHLWLHYKEVSFNVTSLIVV